MGTQETKPGAGKGSLDGLAQRLGALEESLTVVAGELGVSAVPQFKRLDPDSVYREAVRRAQEAIEPLRLALRKLEARLEEIVLAQAQMRREIAAVREGAAGKDALAALQTQLASLAARLDATVMPIDQNESRLATQNETISRLSLRLDTIWERLEAQDRAGRDGTPPAHAVEEKLALLRSQIVADVERRLAQAQQASAAAPVNAPVNAQIDPQQIAAEVALQIQALVKEAATPADPQRLMAEPSSAARSGEMSPLVMSATERAIVRLTHRLEKLEDWRRRNSGDSRGKSGGLMGRLFES